MLNSAIERLEKPFIRLKVCTKFNKQKLFLIRTILFYSLLLINTFK